MTRIHTVSYTFNDQPREHRFESDELTLPSEVAAMHLLQLHFGDAENSLIMPAADAEADEILRQAQLLGIGDIHSSCCT